MAEVVGQCPACGGDVVETSKAFGCSNWKESDGGCKFTIWKTIAKKTITKTIAKQLLEKGRTGLLRGFTSKAGKSFDAMLMINSDDGHKVGFEFEH